MDFKSAIRWVLLELKPAPISREGRETARRRREETRLAEESAKKAAREERFAKASREARDSATRAGGYVMPGEGKYLVGTSREFDTEQSKLKREAARRESAIREHERTMREWDFD